MSEEATEFLQRKYPLVLAILNIVMKRVELIITNLLTAGVIIYFEQAHVHKQIWQETGQHFQDLVQTNNLLAAQITNQQKERK